MRIARRPFFGLIAAAVAALTLAACQGARDYTPSSGDMALGSETAPVTIVEYFSSTCSACAHFHTTVFPTIKENFIDTGKVRWVFRELLTQPRPVSLAGFQMARCGNADGEAYAARVGAIFQRQHEILSAGTAAGIRERLISIGQQSGLTTEQLESCIDDPSGAERVRAVDELARAANISGTPTLLLEGEVLRDQTQYTVEGLSALLTERAAAAQ